MLSSSCLATVRPDDRILTGDRPTGPLHLGHLAGSLTTRLALQGRCPQTVLIADLQALTDHAEGGGAVQRQVHEVALDYLAVGLDPALTTIAVQSAVPALCTLTTLYLNLVSVGRLERNPTVKDEIRARGFTRDVPAGFLCYPVSQAADITGFRATLVPVGEDQLPMIEQANEIVRRVNRLAGTALLPEARALLTRIRRLPGVDGRKASKSFGNAIALSDPPGVVAAKVRAMYTDPGHVRASDPGRVLGNVVFAYLDAFGDPDEVAALQGRYARGGLGDGVLKHRLTEILSALLQPIQARRQAWAQQPRRVQELLEAGSANARAQVGPVLAAVQELFGVAPVPASA